MQQAIQRGERVASKKASKRPRLSNIKVALNDFPLCCDFSTSLVGFEKQLLREAEGRCFLSLYGPCSRIHFFHCRVFFKQFLASLSRDGNFSRAKHCYLSGFFPTITCTVRMSGYSKISGHNKQKVYSKKSHPKISAFFGGRSLRLEQSVKGWVHHCWFDTGSWPNNNIIEQAI
ncbi:MAG: hypothetical protein WC001_10860 [Desulfurivibrionaceae bacterium]